MTCSSLFLCRDDKLKTFGFGLFVSQTNKSYLYVSNWALVNLFMFCRPNNILKK